MSRRIQWVAVVLAALSQAAMADSSASGQPGPGGFSSGIALPERVLHFPPEQSVGEIILIDESYVVPEVSREFHPGYVFAPAQYLGPARGEVRIPAGKGVTRQQCFECLKSLAPNDVQDLGFQEPL